MFAVNAIPQTVPEGILGFQRDPRLFAAAFQLNRGRNQHCRQESLFCFHEGGQCQLGPALREIRGTAAIIRFQPKEIGLTAVGAKYGRSLLNGAGDLIQLLIVLV